MPTTAREALDQGVSRVPSTCSLQPRRQLLAMSLTWAPGGAGSRDLPVLGVSLPRGDGEGYCLCSSEAGENEGEGKEKAGAPGLSAI